MTQPISITITIKVKYSPVPLIPILPQGLNTRLLCTFNALTLNEQNKQFLAHSIEPDPRNNYMRMCQFLKSRENHYLFHQYQCNIQSTNQHILH